VLPRNSETDAESASESDGARTLEGDQGKLGGPSHVHQDEEERERKREIERDR